MSTGGIGYGQRWTIDRSCAPGAEAPTPPTVYGTSYQKSHEASLIRMNRALSEASVIPRDSEQSVTKPASRRNWRGNAKRATELDIALIGAVGFSRHARQRDTELCMTSLYEI